MNINVSILRTVLVWSTGSTGNRMRAHALETRPELRALLFVAFCQATAVCN